MAQPPQAAARTGALRRLAGHGAGWGLSMAALLCGMALCVSAGCGWGKPTPAEPSSVEPTGGQPTGSAGWVVEVLAFGSLHGDGRDDPQPLAGVPVIAIPRDRTVVRWLNALVGVDVESDPVTGVFQKESTVLHRGAQFRVDAQQILASPGVVITATGADGTAQMRLDPGVRYSTCVLSPDDRGLIAGCESSFRPDFYGLGALYAQYEAVLVYFSYGRAYVGVGEANLLPYWYQQIAEDVFDRDWAGPDFGTGPVPRLEPSPHEASIDFYSQENLSGNVMALIEDSQIGAWWDTFHNKLVPPHIDYRYVDAATLESTPATLVPLRADPSVYEEFLATVTIDAGVHLVCWMEKSDSREVFGPKLCVYEDFPAGSHSYLSPYFIEIDHYLTKTRGKGPAQ